MADYHWYPGHMTKAVRMMKENIALVDMVIELLDARIPVSSRNPDIDSLSKGKLRLIVLNKSDLSDEKVNREWVDFFRREGAEVVQLDSRQGKSFNGVFAAIDRCSKERAKKDQKKGLYRPVRAMVAGIPNVGKSTFINRLAKRASAKTGNKPGVTRGKQWISLDNGLQLLDTPGILWPKFEDKTVGQHLAFIGSLNDDNIDKTELAIELIRFLEEYYPGAVAAKYGIDDEMIENCIREEQLFNTEGGILCASAKALGCIMSGGRIDYDRASGQILHDFRNGKCGRFSIERPAGAET